MARDVREQIVESLRRAYCMELETVANYLANSINLDGVRAEEIKKSLTAEITGELAHAQQLGQRIKQLGAGVPGSKELVFDQIQLQPPEDTTDVVSVIRGVLATENQAIEHYNSIIRLTEGTDYVTQDLCITLLGDEERHRTLFAGFLKEYAKS